MQETCKNLFILEDKYYYFNSNNLSKYHFVKLYDEENLLIYINNIWRREVTILSSFDLIIRNGNKYFKTRKKEIFRKNYRQAQKLIYRDLPSNLQIYKKYEYIPRILEGFHSISNEEMIKHIIHDLEITLPNYFRITLIILCLMHKTLLSKELIYMILANVDLYFV